MKVKDRLSLLWPLEITYLRGYLSISLGHVHLNIWPNFKLWTSIYWKMNKTPQQCREEFQKMWDESLNHVEKKPLRENSDKVSIDDDSAE